MDDRFQFSQHLVCLLCQARKTVLVCQMHKLVKVVDCSSHGSEVASKVWRHWGYDLTCEAHVVYVLGVRHSVLLCGEVYLPTILFGVIDHLSAGALFLCWQWRATALSIL